MKLQPAERYIRTGCKWSVNTGIYKFEIQCSDKSGTCLMIEQNYLPYAKLRPTGLPEPKDFTDLHSCIHEQTICLINRPSNRLLIPSPHLSIRTEEMLKRFKIIFCPSLFDVLKIKVRIFWQPCFHAEGKEINWNLYGGKPSGFPAVSYSSTFLTNMQSPEFNIQRNSEYETAY